MRWRGGNSWYRGGSAPRAERGLSAGPVVHDDTALDAEGSASCASPCEEGRSDPALAAIHRSFTYCGEPIHPALVEEFLNWPSDPARSITVAADLAAAHGSNEYHLPVEVTRGWVRYEREPGAGSFSYRWLGTLEDGTHVLRTANHDGGSVIFVDLVLVRFRMERG